MICCLVGCSDNSLDEEAREEFYTTEKTTVAEKTEVYDGSINVATTTVAESTTETTTETTTEVSTTTTVPSTTKKKKPKTTTTTTTTQVPTEPATSLGTQDSTPVESGE